MKWKYVVLWLSTCVVTAVVCGVVTSAKIASVLSELASVRADLRNLRDSVDRTTVTLKSRTGVHNASDARSEQPIEQTRVNRSNRAHLEPDSRDIEYDKNDVAREAAFKRGEQLVSTALALSEWNDDQLTELRTLMPVLSQEQQVHIVRTLVQAVNSGKLQIKTYGPLL